MLSFLGLAAIVVGVVALVAVAVVGGQLFFDFDDRPHCSNCGATLATEDEECTVCQAPFEAPAGAQEDGEPRTIEVDEERQPTIDPEVGALNPGISRTMVRWALVAMFVGIGVRLLGMLDPVGLEIGVPDSIMAALTVIGGVAMFLGFVVLDFA